MPLHENPNLANKQRNSTAVSIQNQSPAKKPVHGNNILSVMRTKSRALISVPADLIRTKSYESVTVDAKPPKLTVDNAERPLSMPQANGSIKEHNGQDTLRIPTGRIVSPSLLRSATFAIPEPSPSPEPAWSSAIGHASTGKSGRVIERLQGDIDRLHREKQLLKVQFEEIEKTNETLVTRIQYLQDRNSNYEHSHETNLRQLERKERQVQDLRDELKREKQKTVRAEEQARRAEDNEETWKDHANQSKAIAAQKETEYNTIVACRSMDNDRHQGGLDKIKASFTVLTKQREDDLDKQKKLEIIAEQQRQTIQHLEELTKKLSTNFKEYRMEIDTAIADLRNTTSENDANVKQKLEQMTQITGEMRWVIQVEREVNHKDISPMPHGEVRPSESISRPETPSSPPGKTRVSMDVKGKFGRRKLGKSTKS